MTTQPTALLSQIHIPDDENVRQDLPRIKELAEKIEIAGGLIQPVTVRNGGAGDKPYTLTAGWRRAAAWKMLGWEKRPIPIHVKEYKKGDILGPVFDNIMENVDREGVHVLDLGEKAHQLVTGTYPVAEGEKAEVVEKAVVAQRLGWGMSHLNNVLRVFSSVDPDVARYCRKNDVPTKMMFRIASVVGTGRTDDAKAESKSAAQMAIAEEWVAQKKLLEEAGKKHRSSPRKKGGKGGDSDEKVALSPDKIIDRRERSEGGETVEAKYRPTNYIAALKAKQESANKEDAARFQGAIDAFRFLTGEIERFPGITAADLKATEPVDEPEEEEDEDD